ncbi:chemotaxis protein CheX [Butyrivibrio sp. VCB2006]|uniref:chemotaxis protein CheX n=1 Tax=Butyrivibrio sp. VCB2006 TaxID=1280679 RepID=UPI0004030BF2|nr:chemotaxis protein CheX [Butyrivibrio sp. VCB2006]
MLDRLLGNYMLEKGLLTKQQLQKAYSIQENNRVKLGVIAVSEKLMTIAQAEQVNALQATMDMRFGDIALEKGYLSQTQLGRLLELQGNSYLAFIQAIVDENFLSMEQVHNAELEYQKEYGYTETDIVDLKSNDVERIVSIFLDDDMLANKELIVMAIKTMYRLIDSHVCIGKAYRVESLRSEVIGYQKFHGDEKATVAICGKYQDVEKLAVSYTKEEFIETEEDALDATCEFINCINGLYATDRSKIGVKIELEPPEFSVTYTETKGSPIVALPVRLSGGEIVLLTATGDDVSIG